MERKALEYQTAVRAATGLAVAAVVQVRTLEHDNSTLLATIDHLRVDKEGLAAQVLDLEQQCSNYEATIHSLESQLAALQASYADDMAELKMRSHAQLAECQLRVEAEKAQVTRLQSDKDALTCTVNSLNASNSQMAAEVRELQEECTVRGSQVVTLKATVDNLTAMLAEAEARSQELLAGCAERAEAAKARVAMLEDNNYLLLAANASVKQDNGMLTAKVDSLSASHTEAAAQLERKVEECRMLAQQAELARAERDKAGGIISQLQAQICTMEAQMLDLKASNADGLAQFDRATEECLTLVQRAQHAEHKHEMVQGVNSKLAAQVCALKAECEDIFLASRFYCVKSMDNGDAAAKYKARAKQALADAKAADARARQSDAAAEAAGMRAQHFAAAAQAAEKLVAELQPQLLTAEDNRLALQVLVEELTAGNEFLTQQLGAESVSLEVERKHVEELQSQLTEAEQGTQTFKRICKETEEKLSVNVRGHQALKDIYNEFREKVNGLATPKYQFTPGNAQSILMSGIFGSVETWSSAGGSSNASKHNSSSGGASGSSSGRASGSSSGTVTSDDDC